MYKLCVCLFLLHARESKRHFFPEQATQPEKPANMQLFVRAEQTHVLDVDETTCVSDVRSFVESVEGIPASEQYVTFAGRPLVDGPLSAFDVTELATLNVAPRVRGGKVHGSLARAGKVKGQTPKVEKQEDKKKAKTGRAKRRQQYNNRFNSTANNQKRSPNSNSA
ncbi:40S ribosomal protein S30 [Salpingoeca rosetta]|uniref:40S ribosomal protein S30 n=1 Tax=Salpingoeca rosetta (strain ATCC 50818 / BSB-021) TaxID=946362 RepID=F2UN50_SALR5|nr:40S ribosomal protein S30 [Salpingoeca rosetta]EGD78549.1 40S ribosomal protein S30 [Salpingoeca rosetta]|eukprot:XP_004989498.1 40S ribosomal protein S30 [Salpingoeca rosetta]